MDPETMEAERELEEEFDNVAVLEPRSFYAEDDPITPGEFDIA